MDPPRRHGWLKVPEFTRECQPGAFVWLARGCAIPAPINADLRRRATLGLGCVPIGRCVVPADAEPVMRISGPADMESPAGWVGGSPRGRRVALGEDPPAGPGRGGGEGRTDAGRRVPAGSSELWRGMTRRAGDKIGSKQMTIDRIQMLPERESRFNDGRNIATRYRFAVSVPGGCRISEVRQGCHGDDQDLRGR